MNLGATVSCEQIMTEKKGIVQRHIKGDIKDFSLFESWFSSKKFAESSMDVSMDMIGMVKTNTKGFCRDTIEKLTEDWLGGYYLVLRIKSLVPGGMLQFTIDYKYTMIKVLYFIVTYNKGITKAGPLYLSKYPYQFLYFPFALLLIPFHV